MLSDYKQRETALDVDKSFIVQAPAGSGKTELLVQRYLKLLTICNNPESVLVLTFTNKAVSEIKERIISSLEMDNPTSEHKQLTFDLAQKVIARSNELEWDILNNYQRLSILTLDSFSAKVVANYPRDDDFSIKQTLDEKVAKQFYLESAKQTLLQINTEVSVKNLLQSLNANSNNFIKLVARMLEFRDKWIDKLFDNKQVNLDKVQRCVKNIHNDFLLKISNIAPDNFGYDFFNICLTNPKFENIKTTPASVKKWQELAKLLLTKTGGLRKSITGFSKENKELFYNIINNFSGDFIDLLAESRSLPDLEIDTEHLTDVAKVLFIANNNLQNIFDELGKTDFTQITLNAKHILSSNIEKTDSISDIALTLDYQVSHILIDEFQDTSYTQLDLIAQVVQNWEQKTGRTLFIVGDPMQAIYQFRGGQVGVFLQVWESGIADINLEKLMLKQNFRSTSSVVEANNEMFQDIFPQENDTTNDDIKFFSSVASNLNTSSALTIHPFANSSSLPQAEKVLEIIKNNPCKEIAILYTSRSHSKEIVRLLNANNIVFESIKNNSLQNNIWTLDLLAIVKILLNPEDKLAWFSFLRSTKIGFTLDEILAISGENIWQNLKNNTEEKSQILYQVFTHAFENFNSFDIVDIFSQIITDLDLFSTMDTIEVIIFNKFCGILHYCNTHNILDEENILQQLQDLYEPSVSSNIKLMTMHQAKGLEFDIVILPHLEKKPKNSEKELIYLSEFKEFGILLATSVDEKNYNYLKKQEKIKLFNERKRLLYVAMTRAKEQTHILANAPIGENPEQNSLLNLLWNKVSHYFDDIKEDTEEYQALKIVWGRYPLTQNPIITIDRLEENQGIDYEQIDKTIIGVVVHRFLQLENFSPTLTQIKNQLLTLGASVDNIESNIKIIQNMLINTQNSADFEFIFKTRTSTQTEKEFIFKSKRYVIDRYFIEDNILWVIDFKTKTANINNFKKQLTTYKNILVNTYKLDVSCAVFWTDSGKLQKINL